MYARVDVVFRGIVFVISMLSLFCVGCGPWPPVDLDTPEKIIEDAEVKACVEQIRSMGYSIELQLDVSPPNIEGEYAMSGRRVWPDDLQLASGVFKWMNQTPQNAIESDYSQFVDTRRIQSGVSAFGEFIRGEGSKFTVYSVLRIETVLENDDVCLADAVMIVDGEMADDGSISAMYLIAIIFDYPDSFSYHDTIGEFNLAPNEASRFILADFPMATTAEGRASIIAGAMAAE